MLNAFKFQTYFSPAREKAVKGYVDPHGSNVVYYRPIKGGPEGQYECLITTSSIKYLKDYLKKHQIPILPPDLEYKPERIIYSYYKD